MAARTGPIQTPQELTEDDLRRRGELGLNPEEQIVWPSPEELDGYRQQNTDLAARFPNPNGLTGVPYRHDQEGQTPVAVFPEHNISGNILEGPKFKPGQFASRGENGTPPENLSRNVSFGDTEIVGKRSPMRMPAMDVYGKAPEAAPEAANPNAASGGEWRANLKNLIPALGEVDGSGAPSGPTPPLDPSYSWRQDVKDLIPALRQVDGSGEPMPEPYPAPAPRETGPIADMRPSVDPAALARDTSEGSDRRLLAAMLMKGANQFSAAFTRQKPDHSMAEGLEKQVANEQIQKNKDRDAYIQFLNATKTKAATGSASEDPTSPSSRAWQVTLETEYPEKAERLRKAGLRIEDMPASALQKILPQVQRQEIHNQNFGFKEDESQRKQANWDKDFERKVQQDTARQANANRNFEQFVINAGKITDRHTANALRDHGNKLETSAPLVTALESVATLAPKLVRGVVPDDASMDNWNINNILQTAKAKGLGTTITPAETQQLIQAMDMAKTLFSRRLAGATFTPEEMERMDKLLGSMNLSDPLAAAAGLDLIRRETYARLKQKEAALLGSVTAANGGNSAAADEALGYYTIAGGISTQSSLFSDIVGGRAYAAPLDESALPAPAQSQPAAPAPTPSRPAAAPGQAPAPAPARAQTAAKPIDIAKLSDQAAHAIKQKWDAAKNKGEVMFLKPDGFPSYAPLANKEEALKYLPPGTIEVKF